MSDEWNAEKMYELGARHARLEDEGDLEGTIATLVDEPIYEFWPMGLHMRGMANVRRYYEHLFGTFMPSIREYTLIEEWVSPTSVAQEYEIVVEAGGRPEAHRVIGVLFVDDAHLAAQGPLLTGERVYASERCVRLMAGDALIDELAAASEGG